MPKTSISLTEQTGLDKHLADSCGCGRSWWLRLGSESIPRPSAARNLTIGKSRSAWCLFRSQNAKAYPPLAPDRFAHPIALQWGSGRVERLLAPCLAVQRHTLSALCYDRRRCSTTSVEMVPVTVRTALLNAQGILTEAAARESCLGVLRHSGLANRV